MFNYVKGIIALAIVLFLVTFGIKNSQPVRVDYYSNFLDLELPLYGMIFISMVIGVVVGMLVGLQSRLHLRRRLKNLQKENKALSEKITISEDQDRGTAPGAAAEAG